MLNFISIWGYVFACLILSMDLFAYSDCSNSIHFLNKNQFPYSTQDSITEEPLRGIVYEKETNKPLHGANIVVVEKATGTTTNALGRFRLENLDSGEYTLQITYVGYETKEVNISLPEDNDKILSVMLEPSSLEFADIIVSPGADLNRRNTINTVDIQLRPINNSQDILDIVPGLFTAQHAGGGKAEQIFLRGFDIDHGTDIHLTLDGMPVNMVSHAHGQGYSDFHFVIPETISQIDFNPGPYYSDKGNFTTAGYAAYQTKPSIEKSKVTVEAGQFNTYRTLALIDLLGDDQTQNAYAATEYTVTDGYFNSNQNFNRINFFAKYNNYLSDSKLFTGSISTFRSKWDASGQIPERAVEQGIIDRFGAIDDTEGGETGRTNLNLKLISTLDNDAVFTNQIYYIKYDFELYSNFTFFLNDPVNGDQIRQHEDRNVYGYKGSYKFESGLFDKQLLTEIGGGFRYDDINDISLANTMNRRTVLEQLALGQIDELNMHAYLDETIKLTPSLRVNAGLRFDHHRYSYIDELSPEYERQYVAKSIVSPKLNIDYSFTPNLELYVKSGIGYHSNDTRVVVARNGEEILPRAYGVDVGVNVKPADRLLINAAIWMLELEQEFVYVGDEAIVEPSGRTERFGLDLSLRYQFTDWLFGDVDLNLTRARSKEAPDGEDFIPLAPSLISKGGLTFKVFQELNGSLRYRYVHDRPANEDNSVVAEGFFIVDAVLNYRHDNYQLGISVENVLNEQWYEAQFDTESRLMNETEPVSEIHFTPGTPFFLKTGFTYFF